MARLGNLTIENARIFFKDFSAAGPYAGGTKRTFCVEIPEDMVEALEKDGWNLKSRESRNDPDALTHYLKVEVSYRARPPKIVCIPILHPSTERLEAVLELDELGVNPKMGIVGDNLSWHVCSFQKDLYPRFGI